MFFKRKIMDELVAWKNKYSGSSALLLEGARRIGKTTVAEEFGRKYYKTYLVINFAMDTEARKLFEERTGGLDSILNATSTLYGVKLYPRETLIVFDEVQSCPAAREMIKALVADGRFDYLETGSLISIRKNVKDIVIPSEEVKLTMRPMGFEEFCWARGDETTVPFMRQALENLQPLGALFRTIMLRFRDYLVVGGMPQAVEAYLKDSMYVDSEYAKRNIISLYREDIAKFAEGYAGKARALFDAIPAMLSHHDKKIVFSSFGSGMRYARFAETLYWLSDSKTVDLVSRQENLDPLDGFFLDESKTKCYMADTGLLLTLALGDEDALTNDFYRSIALGKLSGNEGMIMENIVCQCLKGNHKDVSFLEKKADDRARKYEVDFVVKQRDKYDLIEVKSSSASKITSLKYYKEKYGKRINKMYVLGMSDVSAKDGIIFLPLPFATCI